MNVRWAAACLMLCLASCFARAEVLLAAHPLGLVDVTFSDGFTADMSPFVHGPKWMGAWCLQGFMVKGTGADLFRDGQTILLPIRDTGGKLLQAFGQLRIDEKDPKALHFLYRFTAPEATPINSAHLQFRLPVTQWAGQPLAAIDGPECEPALTKDPPPAGQLLNGQAGGVVIGAGSPHEVSLELDEPHWCTVNDERTWGGGRMGFDSFSIDLYALVADGGTPIAAGQVLEITGVLRFAEPVRILDPPAISPRVSDYAGWKVSLGLSVAQAFGSTLARLAGPMQLKPLGDPPDAAEATSDMIGDAGEKLPLKVLRRVSLAGEGEMQVSQQVTAVRRLDTLGAFSGLSLPRPLFDGCSATLLGPGQQSVVLSDYQGLTSALARAEASGVRIDSRGHSLLTITWKPATWCQIRAEKDAFVLDAAFLPPLGGVPKVLGDGATLTQELTLRWGD